LTLAGRSRAALALTLALTLALALTLSLTRLALPLLPLPLALLTLLALTLLAGVREVAAGLLKVRGGLGQVAIQIDILLGPLEGLAQAIERLLGGCVVALGDVLDGVSERGSGGAARLAGG
jgi:hypothetical protein